MKSMKDLTEVLFEQAEKLSKADMTEEQLELEIKRTKALADVSCRITEAWALALKARQAADSCLQDTFNLPMLLED